MVADDMAATDDGNGDGVDDGPSPNQSLFKGYLNTAVYICHFVCTVPDYLAFCQFSEYRKQNYHIHSL